MDLTSVIERYQSRFREQYADQLTWEQQRALNAMLNCRTAHYGEIQLHCTSCDLDQSRFHSCGHRSCHRCQHHDTTRWLQRQRQKLVPVEYFMLTFTLPYELRALAWHHQKVIYAILIHGAVSTLKSFAINDQKLGGGLGMTAVLHTHSRRLEYHPHVHIIVPGGCLNKTRKQWKKLRGNYLFNEFALATVFRARLLTAIRDAGFSWPTNMPHKWVVDCQHVGKGLPALEYLSRYLYRGVISEKNIIEDDGRHVTFRYLDSHTKTLKTRKVTGETFLWLILQHVLPKGFRRVRDYGFLHCNAKNTLRLIQLALRVLTAIPEASPRPSFRCVRCNNPMAIIGFTPPVWRSG